MIILSYSYLRKEIYMIQEITGDYTVIRLTHDNKSNISPFLRYEDASDVFYHWLKQIRKEK